MSGFLQTLAGGVVGAGAVLAGLYLPPLVAPEPRPEPVPAVARADPFGPGAVILTEGDAACPEGWAPAGRTALSVAAVPEGEAAAEAAAAPGAPASRAFTLCRREGG